MGKIKLRAMAVALCVGCASAALAAGYFTNGVPGAGGTQYPSTIPLTGNETLPADTNLPSGANPASEAITTLQLQGYISGGPTKGNSLIGGDATTNLFQRGTTGASVSSTTPIYGPDRWAYWSGASTALTVSRDSTAANLSVGFKYDFVMQRTSGQTGVLAVCMAQEIESVNSYQFQGQVAEFDFHANSLANFSAASGNITASIVYGTGTDQGVASLQAGTWTGQANASAAVIALTTTNLRYAVFGNVPATATELAVQICWTPVGTAGTSDGIAVDGLQLVRNAAGLAYVSTTTGYLSTAVPATAFERRSQGLETVLQERYAFAVNEASTTAGAVESAVGQAPTATTCTASVPFPVTMRAAPTYTNALTGSTFKLNSAAANVVLTTPFSATAGANTVNNGSVTFTASGLGATPGFGCELVSAAGTGQMLFTSEL